MNYYEWADRGVTSIATLAVPAKDDSITAAIRTAIDARKLGYTPRQIDQLLGEQGTLGVDVVEHRMPAASPFNLGPLTVPDDMAEWEHITL